MNRSLLYVLLLMVVCTASTGCSVFRASPVELSGFLPKGELLKEDRDRAPFNGYWVFNDLQYEYIRFRYGKVYLAPIDTSYVETEYREGSGSEEKKLERIEEVRELASYYREMVRLQLEAVADGGIEVVSQPGPETLSLHLALVQVIPTNPGINLLGTAAGFLVPGGGLLKIVGEGSVAMEGYVTDGMNRMELYEQFKDREGQQFSAFSVKDYQRYAHIRLAIDDWAMQLSELLSTPATHKVEDRDLISIDPL